MQQIHYRKWKLEIQQIHFRKWKLEIQHPTPKSVFFGIVGFPTIRLSKVVFSDSRISNNPTSSGYISFLERDISFWSKDITQTRYIFEFRQQIYLFGQKIHIRWVIYQVINFLIYIFSGKRYIFWRYILIILEILVIYSPKDISFLHFSRK